MAMKQSSKLVDEFACRKPVRTGSLSISIFGDSVSQHGSTAWLGSLIKVLEQFGLNQRQVRTAVFRLVQEDWRWLPGRWARKRVLLPLQWGTESLYARYELSSACSRFDGDGISLRV